MNNIKAIFPPGATQLTVNGLHQWDYGRKLEVYADDLPAVVKVHFACAGMAEAIVRTCSAEAGRAEVAIPDRCLEQPTPITAWIYVVDETSGATVKTLTLVVTPRARPQPGDTPPEDFSDTCAELIAAVNAQVEALKVGNVKVSNAAHADSAGSATQAGRADSATNAAHATRADGAAWADNALYAEHADNATNADRATRADSAGSADFALTAESAASAACDGEGYNFSQYYAKKTALNNVFMSKRSVVYDTVAGAGFDNRLYLGAFPEGKGLHHVCAIAFSTIASDGTVKHFHGFAQEIAQSVDGHMTLELDCALVPFISGSNLHTGSVKVKLVIVDANLYFVYTSRAVAVLSPSEGSVFMSTSGAAVHGETLDTVEVFYR